DSSVRAAAVEALGSLGAKEQAPAIAERLKDEAYGVRGAAVQALGSLGAKEQAPAIAERLKDEVSDVRSAAVQALGSLGAKAQAPAIAERLKDKDSGVRTAIEVLVKLGPLDLAPILHVLGNSYRQPGEAGQFLFLAHFLGGGDRTNEFVISWLGRRPANIEIPVDQLTAEPDEARATLEAFKKAWDMSKDLPQLRQDLASSIAVLVDKASWEASDLPLLNEHEDNLRAGGFAEADTVQRVLGAFQTRNQIETAGGIWVAHAAFWLFLIVLYPGFPQIQAIFFWNPWVRRLLGLGYVGFLLTWVPPLRAILLAPFKESLLADANLEGFDPKMYFEGSPVRLKTSGETQAISAAIPEIKGQIVLEG
ncbi:MAG: HEAT repeat domain-containing protein, partial [Gammaproteobacteria bacterium]